jgi:hypothetical protein
MPRSPGEPSGTHAQGPAGWKLGGLSLFLALLILFSVPLPLSHAHAFASMALWFLMYEGPPAPAPEPHPALVVPVPRTQEHGTSAFILSFTYQLPCGLWGGQEAPCPSFLHPSGFAWLGVRGGQSQSDLHLQRIPVSRVLCSLVWSSEFRAALLWRNLPWVLILFGWAPG